MYRETQQEHFEPILVRSQPIIAGCVTATLILIALACALIGSDVARVGVSASILVATTSAFVAGSSYRLRDLRTRRGNALRNNPAGIQELRSLPPRETIARRLRISTYAVLTGILGLIAATVVGFLTSPGTDVGEWSAVMAILGIVFSALIFVAATFTRPLD